MRRKRFRKPGISVALFPFLAVLICTMGSLILLLVILVQHARVEADTIKRQAGEETPEQLALREQQEDAQWRQDLLMEAREENVEKLSHGRLELSHLEEHIRRLQDQWESLNKQAEEFERLGGDRQQDTSSAEAELSRLRTEIDAAKRKLEDAKRRAAEQPRSYAVVRIPHTQGTLRRPIYIECTATAVILQPEGIALGVHDFLPPLGPGNALDSALRAVREYLAVHGGIDANGEPYPLLIVRPDGATSYSAARDAIKAWDDEFGYELIDADTVLAYPPADPALADEIRRAVELARRRQEMLARSAPTRFRQYLSATRGGSDDGVGFGDGAGSSGGYDSPSGQGGIGTDGLGAGGGSNDRLGQGAGGYSGAGESGNSGGREGASGGTNAIGPGANGNGSESAAQGGTGPGQNPRGGGTNPGESNGPYGGFTPANLSRAGAGSQGGDSQRGGSQGGSPGGSSQGSPGSRGGAGSGPGVSVGGASDSVESIAATRGGNWAVKGGGSRDNAYTRPVRITLTADRLYILPEPHTGRPVQTIELRGATVAHVDAMVSAIQRQIDGWGTPPVRGYWQPVLLVQVAGDGERRFYELRRLLEGSGLDVERRVE
jgi:hypothetical protein